MSLKFDDTQTRDPQPKMTTNRINRYFIAGDSVSVILNGKRLDYTVPTGKTLHFRVIANIRDVV